MNQDFPGLIKKIDEFIRKYYKNRLLRGGLFAAGSLAAFFLAVNILEYFGNFNITVRTILFYIYLLTNLIVLYNLIIIPVLKLYRIGRIISYEEASQIIGKHFPEVKDKLLNTLQLQQMGIDSAVQADILKAGIEQRIRQLSPVPFARAVDLKQNRKYIKYILPPVLLIIILLFAAPSVITEPAGRIIHYSTFYKKPAPYAFKILNPSLSASQQEDYKLDVKVEGEESPAEVYIIINDNKFKLEKLNNIRFSYTFRNLQKNVKFQLAGEDVTSEEFELKVLPRPIVLDFVVDVDYPSYTGKTDETLKNTGDFIVPAGTKLSWSFFTKDTRELIFKLGSDKSVLKPGSSNLFKYSKMFLNSDSYVISTTNEYMKSRDSLVYTVSVVPDAYPSIKVEEFRDTVLDNRRFFKGMLKDDYGFSKMTFNYSFINNDDDDAEKNKQFKINVPVSNNVSQQEFYYYFDMSEINIAPGDEIEYYFEIWDNDGISGSKSTRSQKMVFSAPTEKELEEKLENADKQIKTDINQSILDAKKLQMDIEAMERKLVDKKQPSWQDKQEMQNIIQSQQQLQLQIEQLQLQNQQNNLRQQQYTPVDEEILQKQMELEKLFDEIMTPEMKELIKQMQEMIDKANKDQMSQMLENMKLSNEDINKELDRSLELYKQLEFEKKMQEAIDKLDELSQKQKKLADETAKGDKSSEELKKEQEQLNKEFEDIQKDIDELEQKNKELENPNKFEETKAEQEEINQDMNNSSNSLSKGKNKQASQSQKSASEKMEQLSEKLQEMQQSMEEEQLGEDIRALRDILENLVKVSFEQEALMKRLSAMSKGDPRYVKTGQEQKNLRNALQVIEDSLFALSKRQVSVEAFINREINAINKNAEDVLVYIHDRNIPKATMGQQYVMTSVNNLALLLSETLAQMQQQMAQSTSSSSKSGASCKNPKSGGNGGKPKSARTMRQLQEQLNKQMEEMKNGMKPGGKNNNGQSTSEQFARMAAQQEAIRRMMQQYSEQMDQQGQGKSGKIGEMMNQMEQTESELVNKVITTETLKRQQEILTRLLESEKAEKERELDQKRESFEAKNQNYSNPGKYFEYNNKKFREAELLKTIPPSLKVFYKNKVSQYFLNFEE